MKEKRLTRKYLKGIFEAVHKVCFTTSRNCYLSAHLTQADLSLLTDFDAIKEDLSIVNGSFVTLRDPLKYNDMLIHVRDTMLLAPTGSRSLAQIGKLYGESYHKVEISKKDIEDMQSFLLRDEAKFMEYAVRDALISLIHSLWMDEFNFNIGGGVGVPLSLSSIGRKYVKMV